MHVVAAGVHDTIVHRGEGEFPFFAHGKAIDVSAHHDPFSWPRTLQHRDCSRFSRTRGEIPIQDRETISDYLRRAVLFKGEFRMGVQIMADLDHWCVDVIEEGGKFVSERSGHDRMVVTWPT